MNRLDPDLKRLMKWAQHAPESASSEAPFGFSTRVVARWQPRESASLLAAWQRAVTFAGWISGLIIVAGVAFFLTQREPANTADNFVAAYQVLAKSITP